MSRVYEEVKEKEGKYGATSWWEGEDGEDGWKTEEGDKVKECSETTGPLFLLKELPRHFALFGRGGAVPTSAPLEGGGAAGLGLPAVIENVTERFKYRYLWRKVQFLQWPLEASDLKSLNLHAFYLPPGGDSSDCTTISSGVKVYGKMAL